MNVLSLFDGMSCGRLALEQAGIEVENYHSSEIDKYAIKVADANYPQDTTNRLGSVIDLTDEQLKAMDIDLLIGGSPCQGFSLAGKLSGSSTKSGIDVTSLDQYLELKANNFEFEGQSYLFWEYVRVWKITQPKYFFLENVKVTKKWLPMFNEAMGVEPVMVNSALVSAQNRVRYYWTNIPNISQPEDKGIVLKDILEPIQINHDSEPAIVPEATKKGFIEVQPGDCFDAAQPNSKTRRGRAMVEKSNCLLTSNQFTQYLGRPCELRDFKPESACHHAANATDINGNESIKRVYAETGKAPTLTTCQGGHREPKVLCGASRGRYLIDGVRHDAKGLTAGKTEQMLEVRSDEKTNCLTTVQKDNYIVEGLDKGTRVPIADIVINQAKDIHRADIEKSHCLMARDYKGFGNQGMTGVRTEATPSYRKLTPLECERLQTVPDNYTNHVSNSQRYKMLGNGWTVSVIAHLFKGLK